MNRSKNLDRALEYWKETLGLGDFIATLGEFHFALEWVTARTPPDFFAFEDRVPFLSSKAIDITVGAALVKMGSRGTFDQTLIESVEADNLFIGCINYPSSHF